MDQAQKIYFLLNNVIIQQNRIVMFTVIFVLDIIWIIILNYTSA